MNFCMYDCILVCGEKKEKIPVNKKVQNGFSLMNYYFIPLQKLQSLASQSPFFDRLFNGDFKEKNMVEIPMGDVEGEVSGIELAIVTNEYLECFCRSF